MTKKAAVIGHPIAHSLSPIIHNYWLSEHKIDGQYTKEDVSPESLGHFIQHLSDNNYRGINITVPHKEAILSLVDELSNAARMIGAVNTVIVKDDNTLLGHNTDGEGFIQNLIQSDKYKPHHKTCAMVLGAGGAARAIIYALLEDGVQQVILTNRTQEKADLLKTQFGDRVRVVAWDNKEDILSDATLLVNTTSLGMTGKLPLELSLGTLPDNALVTDIVYAPLMTELLTQAQQQGNPIVTGVGMLLHQAVAGFEAWFGTRPEVTDALTNLVLEKAS